MAADLDPARITATRSWSRSQYPKASVHVVIPPTADDSGLRHTFGGGRAARCGYVIVYQGAGGAWHVLGLRSDPSKGEGNNWHAIPIVEELEGQHVNIIGEDPGVWLAVQGVRANGVYVRRPGSLELELIPHLKVRKVVAGR